MNEGATKAAVWIPWAIAAVIWLTLTKLDIFILPVDGGFGVAVNTVIVFCPAIVAVRILQKVTAASKPATE